MSASVAIRFNAITGDAEKAFSNLTRTVSGFEKSFAGVASSVQGHQQRINQAFEQFSGDKLIREASELAKAIEKVGGASKLTAGEQQKVNSVVTEAIAKYNALGLTAPKVMTDLANATKQVEQPTSLAAKAMGVLGGAFAQFTAANLAASAIQNVIGGIQDLVAQGAKLPGLQSSFARLTAGVGTNSIDMLNALQTATKGLVSNIDLMQSANKAILLGLPVTTDAMADLAKTATVLGKAMGQDATTSLNDLITALGRSSPLILDNLGLTVKVGEANEAYAAKLGKSVDALTDAEEKMAFYEAAMAAAAKKTQELGEQTRTLGELATVAWNAFGNAVTGAVAVMNSQIPKVLSNGDKLIAFLKAMAVTGSPGKALQALQAFDDSMGAAAAGVTAFQNQMERDIAFLDPAAMDRLKQSAKELVAQGLKPLTAEQTQLVIDFDKGKKSASDIVAEFSKYAVTAGITVTQVQRVIDSQKKVTKETDKFAETLKKVAAAQVPLTEAQKQQVVSLTEFGAGHQLVADKLKISEIAVKKWLDGLKAALPQLNTIKRTTADIAAIITGTTQIAPIKRDTLTDLRVGDFDAILGIDAATGRAKNLLDQLRKDDYLEWVKHGVRVGQIPLNPKVEPGLAGKLFGTEDFGRQLGNAIMSAIQGGGSIIGAAGSLIGSTLTTHLAKTLTGGLGIAINGALGGVINALLPGLGALLGPLAEKVASFFTGIFDRNKGRDSVEAFAESFGGFDALHKELNLLGEAGEELWKKLTQGVGRNNPDQAAKAIAEVEAAIAKYRSEQQSANITTEEGAQATIESAAAAAIALDQVNEKLLTNSASWGDWSALVTGYLQKLADDIRALPLPSPIGPVGGGSRPRVVDFSGSSSGGTVSIPVGSSPSPETGSTTIVLEMDSYQVAEAVVPQIPGVVQRYGLAGA